MSIREAPDGYEAALRKAQVVRGWEVTSWLGGKLLGEVPILSGTLQIDGTAEVPGTLQLTVKSTPETMPTSPGHMLGSVGQQLRVRRSITINGQVAGWFDHGWFRTLPVRRTAGVLQVTARSLEIQVQLARLTAPATHAASTYADRISWLLAGLVPVRVDAAVTNRSIGARTYERERLEAVNETLAAWSGVVGYVDDDGFFTVAPAPTGTDPELTIEDGPTGTLIDLEPASTSKDLAPNGFSVSTVPDDGSVAVTEVATISTGPRRWGGPYGRVVEFFASSLLTTRAQCRSTALTMLTRAQDAADLWRISCRSDDRIKRGTVIEARKGSDIDLVGRVVGYELPQTPADEPMYVDVAPIRGTAYGADVMKEVE